MTAADGGFRATAVAALAERRYERAGDEYSRAGWRILSEPRPDTSGFEADEKGWVGQGLAALALAAVAYRVAGRHDRGTHRAVEGIAVARDLSNALTHPVQQACLDTFVADFRVLADLDGTAAAYETAVSAYEAAGEAVDDPREWSTTPLLGAAAAPLKQIARSGADGEIAVTWTDLHGSDPDQPGAFLAHRARYKRQRLPALVDRLLDDGYLAAPRGTTAYNNDQYRCPRCESSDVNWIGDAVVCLRCSTPMED